MPNIYSILLLLLILSSSPSIAQEAKKSLLVAFSDHNLSIDAELNEAVWQTAAKAVDFTVFEPDQGIPSKFITEVMTCYSRDAFYVAAILYDDKPDSVLREFTIRDNDNGNTDAFFFSLNPYNDGQHSFRFYISAANVQTDIRLTGSVEDYDWNAVWESAVKITDKGWIVEVRVPFSMLRIPSRSEQEWGFNAARHVRRTREWSSWNPILYQNGEITTQEGILNGFARLDPPIRLSFYPYLSAYAQSDAYSRKLSSSIKGGMDLKYGIDESFTLDMTLIPDFGQTKSDEIVLNLTPYETYYNENRAFFNEGTELFTKADLFYSRRVGKTPTLINRVINALDSGSVVLENPAETQLINAAKFSGRTSKGLGIGVFNALTDNAYAVVRNPLGEETQIMTEALANFNILVLDQTYRNNSYLNFTNTNVIRPGADSLANVTSGIVRWMDKANKFGFYTQAAVSHKSGPARISKNGHLVNGTLGKFNGNHTYYYFFKMISDQYDPNDLGYLAYNNTIENELGYAFRKHTPGKYLLSYRLSALSNLSQMYSDRAYVNWMNVISFTGTWKNYLSTGLTLISEPLGYHDYFETRVAGRFVSQPAALSLNGWYSSDYRKALALDFNLALSANADSFQSYSATVAPRIRLNNHWFIIPQASYSKSANYQGYARHNNQQEIYFGTRNEMNIQTMITASWVINNKTSFSLTGRHYHSQVDYLQLTLLQDDGSFLHYTGTEYASEDFDINFNVFTMDLLFTWNFLPGSYLNLSWKNRLNPVPDHLIRQNYWTNLRNTFITAPENSFSIQIIYYFDYGMLRSS